MCPVPWPHPGPQSRPPQVTSLIHATSPLVPLLPGPSLDLCALRRDTLGKKNEGFPKEPANSRHVFANIFILLGVKVLEFLYTKFFIKMNDNNLVLSAFFACSPKSLISYDPGLLSCFLWASDSNEHLAFEIPLSPRSCVIFGTQIHSGLVAARMSQTSLSMGSFPNDKKKKKVLNSITPRVYRRGWWAGTRSAKTLSELGIHFTASAKRMQ